MRILSGAVETMKPFTKQKVQKFLRLVHGWLGVVVFPWILVIGLTGFYLNHKTLVTGFIGTSSYDESRFEDWPVQNLGLTEAMDIAARVWPDEDIDGIDDKAYHGHPSYHFEKASGWIIVTKETGHYFVKTGFTRSTYAPDGQLLHKKTYWSSVFKWLHARGWLTSDVGTWLADITAGAMVIFSLSGLWLFFAPRMKKIIRGTKRVFAFKKRPARPAPGR